MTDLAKQITAAIAWCKSEGIEIPLDIQLTARQFGALKASGDIGGINATYHDAITQALVDYFEGGGSVTAPRNAFSRAMVEALGDAFDLGYNEGGGEFPMPDNALGWLNARIEQELGFIGGVFEQAKQLRKDSEFDYFGWASDRADGYTGTTAELFNYGKLFADDDKMLTFGGDDGNESCKDCQKYKGQRHRASWWIARNAVPPSRDFECGGWHCEHILEDDEGNEYTI